MSSEDRDPMIEAAIRALPPVDLPAGLERRVAQIPLEHRQGFGFVFLGLGTLRDALAWGLAGAVGILSGAFLDFDAIPTDAALSFTANDAPGSAWDEDEFMATETDTATGTSNATMSSDSLDQLIAQAWSSDWSQLLSTAESELTTPSSAIEERAQ